MPLANKQFITWLYEGCQRRHVYRVIFERHNTHVGGLSYCAQAIEADHLHEAITFAKRIMEFEHPTTDLSAMTLQDAFILPHYSTGRY